MARKRMLSTLIIDSDAFLDMPLSAQALYMHLNLRADDDGFVGNPKRIQQYVGASSDDLKLLLAKRFILAFENGVIVIKHWKMHNTIQKDRYTPTAYQDELSMLVLNENNSYTDNVYKMETKCIQNVSTDKDIDKDIDIDIDKDKNISISKDIDCRTDVQRIVSEWNTLSAFGISSVSKLSNTSKRYQMLIARLKEYGVNDVIKAIDNVRHSDFLQGRTKGNFIVTFDWFVKPNNFPKVLEGNYNNKPVSEAVATVGGDWQC